MLKSQPKYILMYMLTNGKIFFLLFNSKTGPVDMSKDPDFIMVHHFEEIKSLRYKSPKKHQVDKIAWACELTSWLVRM